MRHVRHKHNRTMGGRVGRVGMRDLGVETPIAMRSRDDCSYCTACIGITDIVIQADPGINNAMVIGCELDKSVSHRVSAVGFG